MHVKFNTKVKGGGQECPPYTEAHMCQCEALSCCRIIEIIVLKYSIVVPLHNEQENVTDLYARLKAVMEASGETFEMVLVDDGSIDGTFALLREIAAVDSRVTVVKLRRNFGQTAGLAAGFDHARGEY